MASSKGNEIQEKMQLRVDPIKDPTICKGCSKPRLFCKCKSGGGGDNDENIDKMAKELYKIAEDNVKSRSKLADKHLDMVKNPFQAKYTKDK